MNTYTVWVDVVLQAFSHCNRRYTDLIFHHIGVMGGLWFPCKSRKLKESECCFLEFRGYVAENSMSFVWWIASLLSHLLRRQPNVSYLLV